LETAEDINVLPKIGEGIFSIQDIAKILGLPYHKVRRVINGFWREYTFGEKGDRAVNFWTLIEFYTYYKLRELGVKPHTIKKAHLAIAKHLGTPYPFASDIIHSDGKGVWYSLVEFYINADGTQQINLAPFIKPFLDKIEFNNSNLAEKFYPLKGSKNIVVDPKYQFGQPVISGTRIKAELINDYYKAGESVDLISKIYNLNKEQVEDAVKYYKQSA
jgi:uncharacterized protein (DUF433 family)